MQERSADLGDKDLASIALPTRPSAVATGSLHTPVNMLFLFAGAIYLAVFIYASVGSTILAPYSDMVDLISDYFRAEDQGRFLEYLFDPHNFHRLLWFRGLIALDVKLFHGTGLPLIVSGLVCLTGTGLLLASEVRRVGGSLALPFTMMAGMLVFLTANAAGVSVPANTPHLHTTFFSILTLVTAASACEPGGGGWRWGAALAFAAAACFSLATALVLWPILILMALHARASWQTTIMIVVASVVFCVAYLMGQPVSAPLYQGLDYHGLVKAAEYFFAYLGLPWVRGSKLLGEILGVAILTTSLFALIRYGLRKTTRTQRLGLSMILFSLGSAVLAAVGRRDINLDIDVPARYAILLAPLHVGLLLLAAPAIAKTWGDRPRQVASGLAAALAVMMVQQVLVGTVVVRAAERARHTITLYQQGQRTPDMLQWIYPDLEKAAAVYAEMRRRGIFLQWVGQLKSAATKDDESMP